MALVAVFICVFPDSVNAALPKAPNNLGLVGYWTLDGKDINWATNNALDISVNGNNGLLVGMSTTTSPVMGKIGQSLRFNGSNSCVSAGTPTVGSLGITTKMTIAAWVKTSDSLVDNQTVISKGKVASGASNNVFSLRTVTTQPRWSVNFSDGVDQVSAGPTSGSPVVNDTWYHLVGVLDGTSATLYVNGGELVYTGTNASMGPINTAANANTNPLSIGCDFADSSTYLLGNADDVRIYNRALSAAEVLAMYRSGSTRIGTAPTNTLTNGLVGYWTLDGKDINWGTGIVADKSTNSNNNQLFAMTTAVNPTIGKVGQGLKFNGTTNYTQTVGTFNGNPNSQGTITFWGNLSNTTSGTFIDTTGSRGIILWISSGSIVVYIYNSSGVRVHDLDAAISANTWNHYTVSYTTSGATLYINGVVVDSDTNAAASFYGIDGALVMGRNIFGGGYLNGTLDDVRIYNRTLSADEIKQLYNLGAGAKQNTTSVGKIPNGLVGHWTFDGKDTNWATGVVSDKSGLGNNGQLLAMSTTTSPVPGKIGQGLRFDGVNDYVNIDPISPSNFPYITIAAWLYAEALPASGNKYAVEVGWNDAWIGINSSGNIVSNIYTATGNRTLTSSGTNYLRRWAYVVVTSDGSTERLYIDGIQVNSTSAGDINWESRFRAKIGREDQLVSSFNFNGLIDDVRIYNRALSADEVKQLYNMVR